MQVGGQHRQGNRTREAVDTMMADTVEPVLQPVDGRLNRHGARPRRMPLPPALGRRSKGERVQRAASSPTRLTVEAARPQRRIPRLRFLHQRHRHVHIRTLPQDLVVQDELILIRSGRQGPRVLPAYPRPWKPSACVPRKSRRPSLREVSLAPHQPPLHLVDLPQSMSDIAFDRVTSNSRRPGSATRQACPPPARPARGSGPDTPPRAPDAASLDAPGGTDSGPLGSDTATDAIRPHAPQTVPSPAAGTASRPQQADVRGSARRSRPRTVGRAMAPGFFLAVPTLHYQTDNSSGVNRDTLTLWYS